VFKLSAACCGSIFSIINYLINVLALFKISLGLDLERTGLVNISEKS